MKGKQAMTKEEAIKHLHTYSSTNGSGQTTQDQHEEAKKMAIKALETQLQWIPVSDRLPTTDRRVLCQTLTKKGNINFVLGYYFLGGWVCGMNSNVVAWMELPEPWEGKQ